MLGVANERVKWPRMGFLVCGYGWMRVGWEIDLRAFGERYGHIPCRHPAGLVHRTTKNPVIFRDRVRELDYVICLVVQLLQQRICIHIRGVFRPDFVNNSGNFGVRSQLRLFLFGFRGQPFPQTLRGFGRI